MPNAILRGKPDAGNPHVAPTSRYGDTGRFDEGNFVPAKPRREALPYRNVRFAAALVLGLGLASAGCSAVARADASRGVQTNVVTVAEPTTESLQAAVDAASAAGGGKVVVPPGEWRVGTIVLKSNVELHLAKDAVLKATRDKREFRQIPQLPGNKASHGLVIAWYAENIALTGEGELNGDGLDYFEHDKPTDLHGRFFYRRSCGRPWVTLFNVFKCKGVRLEDVTLRDSSSWTAHVRLCEDVTINRVKFLNDVRWINSDGLDLDASRNVTMRNCKVVSGDDAIVLRAIVRPGLEGPTVLENVLIEDCDLESGCQCVRVGCPSDDTVRNCTLRRIRIAGFNGIFFDNPVAYLSSKNEGFVDVHDMVLEDFTGTVRNYALQATVAPGIKIRGIRNCLFKNFDVHSKGKPRFIGNIWSKFENLRHENFRFNGELLPDGEFVGDFTNDKPLRRRTKKIDNSRPKPNKATVTEAAVAAAPSAKADVEYIAHAGEEFYGPGHSPAAYRAAVEHGLDYLKMDLHETSDKEIVLSHDSTLTHLFDCDWKIKEHTLAEIRANCRFCRATNDTIQTLAEGLKYGVKMKKGIWLDFKAGNPAMYEKALKIIAEAGITSNRMMIATWNKGALEYMKKHHPEIRRVAHTYVRPKERGYETNHAKKGQTFATPDECLTAILKECDRLGLYGLNMPIDIVRKGKMIYDTPEGMTAKLRARGLWVARWFVFDEKAAALARAQGSDAFVTNCKAHCSPEPSQP